MLILAIVVQQMFLDKADLEWKDNFYVAFYPINADDSDRVARYIKTLRKEDFDAMESFFAEEAKRYDLGMRRPVAIQLGDEVEDVPPAPPPSGGSKVQAIIWSLKFRWFAWNNTPKVAVKPDIRLYLLFYDPQVHNKLSHSTALNKGRIGRVNLFGDSKNTKKNLVVTAHELLHTLTASDKYDLSTGQPIYPDGYADPEKTPRYPQYFAELMGGYVPISETSKKIPASLKETLIGYKTAREIGWVR
ncbi:MAG: hypothetical protein ACKE5M_06780 [Methylophilaceae bacterium]